MSNSQTFSNKLFYCYLFILCWAPLPLGSNRDWSLSLLMIFCLVLALGMLWQVLKKNNIHLLSSLKTHKLSILLFALVPIWASIQCLPLPPQIIEVLSPKAAEIYSLLSTEQWITISLEIGRTKFAAFYSWVLWLFFIMTLLLLNSRDRVKTVFIVIVLSGVFQALYGSFMTISGIEYGFFTEKESYRGVATGTFVNRNHLAGYLEMCLAVGIGLLVASLSQKRNKGWRNKVRHTINTLLGAKMRLRVFLALMVIALVLTRSRMGNTAFFISLPLCGAIYMILRRKLHKGAIILFVSLMLIDAFIIGQWFGFSELADRIQNTSAQAETRDEVIRDSLVMLQDFPLTGTGLGTFASSFPQYAGTDIRGFYDHTHNDYLEFATGLGAIGFIPLALLVIFSLFKALATLYKRHDHLAKGLAFAATMGIVSLLIHSSVDFNLQIPANALLFIVLLAFCHLGLTLPGQQKSK